MNVFKDKRKGFFPIFMIAIFLCFVTNACFAVDKVTIGWYGPTSGSNAQDGQDGRIGAEIARDLVNAKGGVNGRQVEIIFADDKGDPKEGANIASMFVSNKDILGVAGPFNSSVMLAAAPIYNKAKLCNVGWGVSSPMITTAGPYIYRVQFTDAMGGDFVAKWMVKDDEHKKIAIIYENTDYGQGLLNVVKASAEKYGADVVTTASYMQGQTKDFSSIIASIKEAKPDAIFMGSVYNETALFAIQAKDLGLNTQIYGTDGLFSNGLLDIGGDAVNGIRCFCVFFHEFNKPAVKTLVEEFNKKYPGKIPSTWTALSYDSTMTILEAIKKTNGKTRADVKKGLDNFGMYNGATGLIQFDENGDVKKEFSKIIVENKQFVPLKQ